MTPISEARRRADAIFGVFLVVVFGYAAWAALGYPEDARLLPLAVAIPAFLLAAFHVASTLRPRPATAEEAADEPDALPPAERTRRTAQVAGWILGIFLTIYLLGFLIAVPLAAIAYLRLMAREGWVLTAMVAGLCWALVFGIFDRMLHVPLPPGVLLRVLGVT